MTAANKRTLTTRQIRNLAPLYLILLTAICVVLAAVLLDVFIQRPIVASVTTLVPGLVYGLVLTLKICIAEALAAGVIALAGEVWTRSSSKSLFNSSTLQAEGAFPLLGILSLSLTPVAILLGAIAILVAQALVEKPEGISFSYFPQVARTGVFVMLGCLSLAGFAAIAAFVKGERPFTLPLLAFVVSALLIFLFQHFEFYSLRFDQDRWAMP